MHPDNHLLARYLAGEATERDHQDVDAWLAESPRHRVMLDALQRVWQLEPPPAPAFDAHATVARILQTMPGEREISQRETTASPATSAPRHGKTPSKSVMGLEAPRFVSKKAWWRGITGLVVCIGVAATARFAHQPPSARLTTRVYHTKMGQLATVDLGDGTRVTLGPQTALRVFGYDRSTRTEPSVRLREVALTGDAYFNVQNAGGAPLIVHTGAVSTRVLGTKFVVHSAVASSTDRRVRVEVLSGKVLVAAQTPQHPSAVLIAGYAGVVTDSSAIVGRANAAGADTAWVDGHDGRLVFHLASTGEVLDALTRWYGYQFRVTDSAVAAKNWNIVLSTRSSRDALSTLRTVFDVDLRVDGTMVTLVPRGKNRTPVERRDVPGSMIDDLTHFQRETGR